MNRFDVINTLIKRYGYLDYLEIGTQADVCLREIVCEYKVGVDPDPYLHDEGNSDEFFVLSSDDFFKQNTKRFDIIFIDGLHEEKQVRRDIANAIKTIRPGGSVVVHDCNPQEEVNQEYPMPHVGSWNGTVWRAWLWYRGLSTYSMYVIDTDEGCGVIQKGWQTPIRIKNDIAFAEFAEKRKELLNLISVEEWLKHIGA